MDFTETLHSLGWPHDANSGTLSWSNGDLDRNHMKASLSMSASGEITMTSQVSWGERSQQRFNAMVAPGASTARVEMPGYERADVPVAQALSLFRAHTAGLSAQPTFRSHAAFSPPRP